MAYDLNKTPSVPPNLYNRMAGMGQGQNQPQAGQPDGEFAKMLQQLLTVIDKLSKAPITKSNPIVAKNLEAAMASVKSAFAASQGKPEDNAQTAGNPAEGASGGQPGGSPEGTPGT